MIESACWDHAGHVGEAEGLRKRRSRWSVEVLRRVCGRVPPTWHVHHTCDNGLCLNPAHLLPLPAAIHRWAHNGANVHRLPPMRPGEHSALLAAWAVTRP